MKTYILSLIDMMLKKLIHKQNNDILDHLIDDSTFCLSALYNIIHFHFHFASSLTN